MQKETLAMKAKFTLAIKRYILNRIIDEASAERLSKHNLFQRLKDDKHEVMGTDFTDKPITHLEQKISQAFSARLKRSEELALTLKLIREDIIPISTERSHIWVSIYSTTRFGKLYRRLPKYHQVVLLCVVQLSQRFIKTTTKYKWLAGMISFTTLAVKVWVSGAVAKLWILVSALVGVAFLGLLSFFS